MPRVLFSPVLALLSAGALLVPMGVAADPEGAAQRSDPGLGRFEHLAPTGILYDRVLPLSGIEDHDGTLDSNQLVGQELQLLTISGSGHLSAVL